MRFLLDTESAEVVANVVTEGEADTAVSEAVAVESVAEDSEVAPRSSG